MSPEPLSAAHKTTAATRLRSRARCCTRIAKLSLHNEHFELLNPFILRELQAAGDLQLPLPSTISSACPDLSMPHHHDLVSKRPRIGSHQARNLFGYCSIIHQAIMANLDLNTPTTRLNTLEHKLKPRVWDICLRLRICPTVILRTAPVPARPLQIIHRHPISSTRRQTRAASHSDMLRTPWFQGYLNLA